MNASAINVFAMMVTTKKVTNVFQTAMRINAPTTTVVAANTPIAKIFATVANALVTMDITKKMANVFQIVTKTNVKLVTMTVMPTPLALISVTVTAVNVMMVGTVTAKSVATKINVMVTTTVVPTLNASTNVRVTNANVNQDSNHPMVIHTQVVHSNVFQLTSVTVSNVLPILSVLMVPVTVKKVTTKTPTVNALPRSMSVLPVITTVLSMPNVLIP